MTLTNLAFLLFVAAGSGGLFAKAWSDYRGMMRRRSGLLDGAAGLLSNPSITIGPDGFPVLSGCVSDGRQVRIEIIADTLVPRRLPQLWLKVTVHEPSPSPRPSLGVLARPTGAEFYSLVPGLPEWVAPPFEAEIPLLMRGRGANARDVERMGAAFRSLFTDVTLKEATITPGGVRIVRQIAQGDRGAHMLYRQIRFPVDAVRPALVRKALQDAELLRSAMAYASERHLPEVA